MSPAERVARESFGRLVALLAARFGDVAGAEDALADALLLALERWPQHGAPENPEAWLLTVARRRHVDGARHAAVADRAGEHLRTIQDELEAASAAQPFPDERLALLCVCAHPSLDPGIRTPLMLQTVLGLDAARIASAFLVSPDAMTKRLGRAKAKIKQAGIAFALPDREDLGLRLTAVLDGIYAAYGLGWDDLTSFDRTRAGLTEEAIWLGRLVASLAPVDPEALGLLALMLFCESRRHARRDAGGRYVPLGEQDTERWSSGLIEEAEALLRRASRSGQLGPYQIEAAIQAVHAARRSTGETDWRAVLHLYDGLLALAPTLGASVGRAAALSESGEPGAALQALSELDERRVGGYPAYWAVQGHVLLKLGRAAEAAISDAKAAGLTEDGAVRAYLLHRSTPDTSS